MSVELKPLNQRQIFLINKILSNPLIDEHNGYLWTIFHDLQLYDFVIKYNFNFFEISNKFQNLCNADYKYDYSEDAVRLHWGFLHAMRMMNKKVDSDYYAEKKLIYERKMKNKKLKEINEEKINALEEKEKEEQKRKEIKENEEKEKLLKKQKEKELKELKEKQEKQEKEEERKRIETERKKRTRTKKKRRRRTNENT